MIKHTVKIDNEVTTIECETMDELIQYLKADKNEAVNVIGVTANETVDKALIEFDSFNKAFADRMDKINSAPNYID